MAIDPQAAGHMGDPMRLIRGLSDRVDALENALSLESASIGEGGLDVRGGAVVIYDAGGTEMMRLSTAGLSMEGLLGVLGDIQVRGGAVIIFDGDGNETLRLSTDGLRLLGALSIEGGADVRVNDGGNFEIQGGGRLQALYGDQTVSAALGPIWDAELTEIRRDGVLVQNNAAAENADIFKAWRDRSTGETRVESDTEFNRQAFGSSFLVVNDEDFYIQCFPANDAVTLRYGTTAASANLNTSANGDTLKSGLIRVSTSSRRRKVDITDHVVDVDAVLALQPRSFRDRGEVEENPDTDRWHVGFVAEEVDNLGLSEFVDYNADGTPESVTYDRLCVALLDVVKSQDRRLSALEERISRLDNQSPEHSPTAPTRLPLRKPMDISS